VLQLVTKALADVVRRDAFDFRRIPAANFVGLEGCRLGQT